MSALGHKRCCVEIPQAIHICGRYNFLAGDVGGFELPSSFAREPANSRDNFQAQQKQEFDRWRTAIEIVQRFREAGISCELSGGSETRQ